MGKKSRLSTGRLKSGVLSASVTIAHDPTFLECCHASSHLLEILRRGSARRQLCVAAAWPALVPVLSSMPAEDSGAQ